MVWISQKLTLINNTSPGTTTPSPIAVTRIQLPTTAEIVPIQTHHVAVGVAVGLFFSIILFIVLALLVAHKFGYKIPQLANLMLFVQRKKEDRAFLVIAMENNAEL